MPPSEMWSLPLLQKTPTRLRSCPCCSLWTTFSFSVHKLRHQIELPWWLRWYRTCLLCRRPGFSPWVGKIAWRREWQPTPVFLPGESHGQMSLVGYNPCGCKESNRTERLILSLSSQNLRSPLETHLSHGHQ